ncbi:ankyrin repeat-containing protein At5g02620-like [Triticum dicoccoides]|uniref:ankyrin repeat-containing protein At5g02620-like n=1 Tax=Triticum dicoccoides TaxID=85692 RepID=UPI00188EA483|nr:ankyrin repeat-containing protein At5g02620-like [Triticum dicoccoides]
MELQNDRRDRSSMESAQDLVRKFRSLLQLMAARSGDYETPEDAAVTAAMLAGWHRDVVIDLAAASEGDTQLHRAAAGGDGVCYRRCVALACDGDSSRLLACNGDGDTPLHCAARAGHTGMVKHLIGLAQGDGQDDGEMAKTMVRMQNNRGETALHEAIRSGYEKDVKTMVEDLLAVDNQLVCLEAFDGTSPLFLAVSLGQHWLASWLYEWGHKKLSYSGPEGQNALHAAALDGFRHNTGIAKRLLHWNNSLARQADNSGSTPLHFAASAQDPTLELFLFVFGDQGFESHSPLSLTTLPKKWVYKFYKWREHPTFLLVDANPHSAFQPDRNSLYPVHVAASAGSLVPIIILLCHSPGCAGLRDNQGRTFLHIAVEKKKHNIVWFVARRLDNKAIMNIQDYNGNTAMHLAVGGGSWNIFKILIGNKHVCLNLTNKEGETPMDIALSNVTPTGFYFGMHARRRILVTLTLANGKNSFCRRDLFLDQHVPKLNEKEESDKITSFAQIVGVGSVLVATATFAATFTMPGGPNSTDPKIPPNGRGGTPTLAGLYAFDAFVISNTLAFICSTLATFSLVYTGVATVDIEKRIKLVAFSLALLISAARSFCAAFAFAIYVMLPPTVAHGTAMAACVMTVLALMDAFWFMWAIVTDTIVLVRREDWRSMPKRLMKLAARILINTVYVFWPYIVIFGLLAIKSITGRQETSAPAGTPTQGL